MKHRPEQILEAAVDLLADEGIGVSTARVARAAGVSNGTLFNYFPTKQELLDALYVHVKEGLGRAIAVDPDGPLRDAAHAVWNSWIGWAKANPRHHHVSKLLHESGLASEVAIQQVEHAFAAPMIVLQRLADSDELVDLPVPYLAALLQAQMETAISADLDPQQIAIAFEVMWNGITNSFESPAGSATSTTTSSGATT